MYISITGSSSNKNVYITQSYCKPDGKTSSRIYKKLGKYNDLLADFSGDHEKMMAWAKEEAAKETALFNQQKHKISIDFSQTSHIPLNETRTFNAGYLFLQHLCHELRLDAICRNIRNRRRITYDLFAILTNLIYARTLSPSGKMSSFSYCRSLLESSKYAPHNVYPALTVLAEESDYIQEALYRNSTFVYPRNARILYYDCVDFCFETEEKNKRSHPDPFVTMGIFMDADGIPLAFDLFQTNRKDPVSLTPLEEKVLRDFNCGTFLFCTDRGLGDKNNPFYNTHQRHSYAIPLPLKELNKETQNRILDPTQFQIPGSDQKIDLRSLDETDPETFDAIYYKTLPHITENTAETVIVTYSPRYRAFQQKTHSHQLESSLSAPPFDGFYAVTTNPENSSSDIINFNKHRWDIGEMFRIMKSEFETKDVYIPRDSRIKAHFLVGFISLLMKHLLVQKLDGKFSGSQITAALSDMKMTHLSKESGYIPAYNRTDLTDALHCAFGFRTDFEFISNSNMRNIIRQTKFRKVSDTSK